jgi:hypothetical protein
MDFEPEEDTLVRPAALVVPDPDDVDADTIIRERLPFADVPDAALVELRPPVAAVPRMPQPPAEDAAQIGHSFRVNSGQPIPLASPALIGRRPSLPRITTGRKPTLVQVESSLREVSATHLELRQHGALVIVTDLRSTNGSVVRIPGRDPMKLRQGESATVVPGTVVDIGDGNSVEIMPLQRLEPDERQQS